MMNWDEKMGKFIFLKKKTPRGVHNHSIWISIQVKMKEKNKEIEIVHEERENDTFS